MSAPAAVAMEGPGALTPEDMARHMLLGQHSVRFTADYVRLPEARVQALAEAMVKARRIPKVRP
jgi:hypothetical protein